MMLRSVVWRVAACAVCGAGGMVAHAQSAPAAETVETAHELGYDPSVFPDYRMPDVARPVLDVAALTNQKPLGVAERLAPEVGWGQQVWFSRTSPTDALEASLRAERASVVEALVDAKLASRDELEDVELVKPGVCLVLPTRGARAGGMPRPDAVFRWSSVHREGEGARPELETAWFHLHRARSSAADQPPRGIVLLMPGLLGTPEGTLSMLMTRLRRDGWHVLYMVAQPSRFTQRVRLGLIPGEAESSAQLIAKELGPRTWACADATRQVFALLEQDEAFAGLPRVAVGFSAGAMTLPTVVAGEPDAYSGAVMVGGGCHYWLMSQTSNYNDWIAAIAATWTREPSDAERLAVEDAYLDVANFDAFHTASVLRGKATLMIQGSVDRAVPSPLGEALWERAGRPERWVYPVGHELLFAQLPGVFDKMVAWLDEHVPHAARTGAGQGAP